MRHRHDTKGSQCDGGVRLVINHCHTRQRQAKSERKKKKPWIRFFCSCGISEDSFYSSGEFGKVLLEREVFELECEYW